MKLIVGLGNPGIKYQSTRHNAGFMVINKLTSDLCETPVSWQKDRWGKSMINRSQDIVFVKPQTFVNRSGSAVKSLADFYKIGTPDIWLIHDDIDLPLGKIRIRTGGGSGGHNGVNSVIEAFKTDQFTRFRLGIGRGQESVSSKNTDLKRERVISFVLSEFNVHEAEQFRLLIDQAVEAVKFALTSGIESAMNKYN